MWQEKRLIKNVSHRLLVMSQGFNEARKHAELAIAMFNEGLNLISKGDIIQSSEKLYKSVEEAIKALAIAKGLDEPGRP